MLPDRSRPASLTTITSFPEHYFLENLAIRADGSILVTVVNHKELWYVPPPSPNVQPTLLFTFNHLTTGIAEAEPDVFYICSTDAYGSHASYLYRLDLRDWTLGAPAEPTIVLQFPEFVRGLNGSCLVAPSTLLVADCFAGLIWRVDLPSGGRGASARVWLRHASMAHEPDSARPNQPGVNGIRYAAKTSHLYYTSTAKKLFMRVRVHPDALDPIDEPEFVAGGMMGDDFCLDEDAGVAYVTTHRENTIERVSLEPRENSALRHCVAGEPFTGQLVGPTSGAWGRNPGDYGRVAYFTTDGGHRAPPADGIVRPATIVRVEFSPSTSPSL